MRCLERRPLAGASRGCWRRRWQMALRADAQHAPAGAPWAPAHPRSTVSLLTGVGFSRMLATSEAPCTTSFRSTPCLCDHGRALRAGSQRAGAVPGIASWHSRLQEQVAPGPRAQDHGYICAEHHGWRGLAHSARGALHKINIAGKAVLNAGLRVAMRVCGVAADFCMQVRGGGGVLRALAGWFRVVFCRSSPAIA